MHTKIHNDIDRKKLLKFLYGYYGLDSTVSLEELGKLVKTDLKDKRKMRRLFDHINYDPEEFFYHAASLFGEIFNKLTIKRIRKNLEVDKEQLKRELHNIYGTRDNTNLRRRLKKDIETDANAITDMVSYDKNEALDIIERILKDGDS